MSNASAEPASAAAPQRRGFRMHKRLLFDVISRQAGSVHKAVQEAVQNSIDAGASYCRLEIDRNSIRIADDGKGFSSMQEIEDFFEEFGHPHDEEAQPKFGRYRMGRGQLFTFGHNQWLSNGFKMSVDLNPADPSTDKEDLGYDLSFLAEPVKGCSIDIDLYEPLTNAAIDEIEREIKDLIRYVDIEVSLNGTALATAPSKEKGWTVETDEAWIRMSDKGSLDVYNQGVLVQRHPASRFGTGGTVVTKGKIDVNFARTEILSTCPIWKRIRKEISSRVESRTATKTTKLDANERSAIYRRITGREAKWNDVKDLKFIETVTGALVSPDMLRNRIWSCRNTVAFAPSKDVSGDMAMQSKAAFVFCEDEIARMGASSPEEYLATLAAIDGSNGGYNANPLHHMLPGISIMSRESLEDLFGSDDHAEILHKDLKPAEKLAIDIIGLGAAKVHGELLEIVKRYAAEIRTARGHHPHSVSGYDESIPFSIAERYVQSVGGGLETGIAEEKNWSLWGSVARRTIKVGASEVADAWTDGEKSIWINRKLLPLVSEGAKGIMKLGSIVLHEYLHNEADTGSHVHDEAFYSLHHDMMCDTDVAGAFMNGCLERAVSVVRREKKKPTGAFRKLESYQEELTGTIFPVEDAERYPVVDALAFPEAEEAPAASMGGM